MNAPMQPDPLDAPDWLVTLLGEHDRAETVTPDGWFLCNCLDPSMRLEAAQIWGYDNRAKHRAHVAAVVWQELYRRMSEVNPDDNMLDALGGDDD